MPSLEDVLASIPGMGGYRAAQQYQDKRQMGEIQQVGALQKIMESMQEQDLMKSLGGQMAGAAAGTPEQLEALAMRLAAAKHPGAAAIATLADRRRKQTADAATLKTIQTPAPAPVQSAPAADGLKMVADTGDGMIPGTNWTNPSAAQVPPEERAAFDKVLNEARTKNATARGDGGLFATLMQSEIPAIANQARVLQQQANASDPRSVSPQHWVDLQRQLAAQESTAIERRTAADTAAAERRTAAEAAAAERRRAAAEAAAARPVPAPQVIQTDQGPMHVDRNGRATPILGPDGQPIQRPITEKALPAAASQKLLENQTNLRRAETALALMEGKDVGEMKGDPDATGWKGFLPDAWLQRWDEKGTDARAALADLGSLVIHERSGAAVTAAEFPRLQPFIPKINDDPETVKKKLRRFAQVYKEIAAETANFYRESGYKVPDLTPSAPAAPAAPAGGAWNPEKEQRYQELRKKRGS